TLLQGDSGWQLESAIDINDAGLIVGFGRFKKGPVQPVLLRPGCDLSSNITLRRQHDIRWNPPIYSIPYGHGDQDSSSTIGKWGCALTSLSMGLSFAGLDNDPGTLNDFMRHMPLDYSGLSGRIVNFEATVRDASSRTSPFARSSNGKLRLDN